MSLLLGWQVVRRPESKDLRTSAAAEAPSAPLRIAAAPAQALTELALILE